MTAIYQFELGFLGPAHFGDTGVDLENVTETIGSDGFFSALANSCAIFYGPEFTRNLLERFRTGPPFLVSSLFLYHGECFFLPKPLLDSTLPVEMRVKEGKELKKVRWLNPEGFCAWLSPGGLDEELVAEMKYLQNVYREGCRKKIRPRVTLDRGTRASALYHSGYVRFAQKAGLYGFVACAKKEDLDLFHNLLRLLGQSGLGGERTYGFGQFQVKRMEPVADSMKKVFSGQHGFNVLLSRYHPATDEWSQLGDTLVGYGMTRSKGWITSGNRALPLKRNSVGLFLEGSVMRTPLKGSLADVTPGPVPPDRLDHRVYRYGYAFLAPQVPGGTHES